MNIQIVNETGCFMYLDNEGNYVDSFFIGQYWFNQLTTKQRYTLKEILQKDNITPYELFYKNDNLYLTFVNFKNDHCVYEIYTTGEARCHLQQDVLELADNDLIELHDFLKIN